MPELARSDAAARGLCCAIALLRLSIAAAPPSLHKISSAVKDQDETHHVDAMMLCRYVAAILAREHAC